MTRRPMHVVGILDHSDHKRSHVLDLPAIASWTVVWNPYPSNIGDDSRSRSDIPGAPP